MDSALTDEAFAHTSAPQLEGKIWGFGSLAPSYCYCHWSGRDRFVSQSDFQTVETEDPKEMGIILGISSWEKERVLAQRRGAVSWGEISHLSENFSDHLTG